MRAPIRKKIVKESQDTEDIIESENAPTHTLEASPPFQQFQCYYCEQHFINQRELVAHIDNESGQTKGAATRLLIKRHYVSLLFDII